MRLFKSSILLSLPFLALLPPDYFLFKHDRQFYLNNLVRQTKQQIFARQNFLVSSFVLHQIYLLTLPIPPHCVKAVRSSTSTHYNGKMLKQ